MWLEQYLCRNQNVQPVKRPIKTFWWTAGSFALSILLGPNRNERPCIWKLIFICHSANRRLRILFIPVLFIFVMYTSTRIFACSFWLSVVTLCHISSTMVVCSYAFVQRTFGTCFIARSRRWSYASVQYYFSRMCFPVLLLAPIHTPPFTFFLAYVSCDNRLFLFLCLGLCCNSMPWPTFPVKIDPVSWHTFCQSSRFRWWSILYSSSCVWRTFQTILVSVSCFCVSV